MEKIRYSIVCLAILASAVSSSDVQCRRSIFQIANVFYRTFDLTDYVETAFGAISLDSCNKSISKTLYSDTSGNMVFRSPKDTAYAYLINEDRYYKILQAMPDIQFAMGKDVIFAVNNRQLLCIEPLAPKIFRRDSISMRPITLAGKSVHSVAVDETIGDVLLATSAGDGIVQVKLMIRTESNPCVNLPDLQTEDYKYKLRTTLDRMMQQYRGTTLNKDDSACVDMAHVMLMSFIGCTRIYGQHVHNESHAEGTPSTSTDDRGIQNNVTVNEEGFGNFAPTDATNFNGFTAGNANSSVTSCKNNNVVMNAKDTLQSLVEGTNLIEPFFQEALSTETITANDVAENERTHFYCLEKSKVKQFQQSISGAGEQFTYLMQGLRVLKSTLENEYEPEEVVKDDYASLIDVRSGM